MNDEDDILGPGAGHNSKGTDADPRRGAVAAKQLQSIVERIERLEEEKKATADDIKEVFAEAKGNGFDVKTIRKVLQIRKKPKDEREEEEALLDLYLSALGMV